MSRGASENKNDIGEQELCLIHDCQSELRKGKGVMSG